MKFPPYYKIPTPVGYYRPDFGMVIKRKSSQDGMENEHYIIIETKENDSFKMKCAVKCFAVLGVEVEEVK